MERGLQADLKGKLDSPKRCPDELGRLHVECGLQADLKGKLVSQGDAQRSLGGSIRKAVSRQILKVNWLPKAMSRRAWESP